MYILIIDEISTEKPASKLLLFQRVFAGQKIGFKNIFD